MRSYVLKGLCIVLVLWILILALSSLPTYQKGPTSNKFIGSFISNNGDANPNRDSVDILRRIDSALAEIQMLKRNNAEMKKIILKQNKGDRDDTGKPGSLYNPDTMLDSFSNEPSDNYEKLRRYMELDLNELWYNIRSHSKTLSEPDLKQMQDIYRYDLPVSIDRLSHIF